MPSTGNERSRSSFVGVVLALLALLALGVLTWVLVWPLVRPLPFDPHVAYQEAERLANLGRWEELERELTRLSGRDENTRFDERTWVRWLNLARRLGLATRRWRPLLELSFKSVGELPGNPTLQTFHLYARIRAADFSGLPPRHDRGGSDDPILRRYLLDYHASRYFQRSGASGVFRTVDLLQSRDLGFWAALADAFPGEPLFNARALILSLAADRADLFLRYLTSLELTDFERPTVFSGWDPARVFKLVGLASFKLGRWQTAANFLGRNRRNGVEDRTSNMALAESLYRLGELRESERVMTEELRGAVDPLVRARLVQNLSLLALTQAELARVRPLAEDPTSPPYLRFYLQAVLSPSERPRLRQRFLERLGSESVRDIQPLYFYYASFPDVLTPTLLNTALQHHANVPTDDEYYLQSLVGMFLWVLNREGKFAAALEFGNRWSTRWPDGWMLRREMALALAQIPGRASEAYDLWNTAPLPNRDALWEYNASRLAAALVRPTADRRDYALALAHNVRAQERAARLPDNPATRRFLARILFDRAVWAYYSGRPQESRAALFQARRLDPDFLAAQNSLNTAVFEDVENENQD